MEKRCDFTLNLIVGYFMARQNIAHKNSASFKMPGKAHQTVAFDREYELKKVMLLFISRRNSLVQHKIMNSANRSKSGSVNIATRQWPAVTIKLLPATILESSIIQVNFNLKAKHKFQPNENTRI